MDIDMDLDLGLADEDGAFAQDDAIDMTSEMVIDGGSATPLAQVQQQTVPDIYNEDITVMPARDKVHIRGLDHLATEDVHAFAGQYYPECEPIRIEWVDDTSANFIYPSADAASEALVAFSDPGAVTDPTTSAILPPSQLRPAKPLSTHPDTSLSVRQGLTTDVKKSRAREASRFYLMNPDKDPSNRPRRGGPRKRRYAEDDGPDKPFDVNMYDDDETSLAARTRRASDGAESRQAKRQRGGTLRDTDMARRRNNPNAGKELFRNRSASPRRRLIAGEDGRFGFEEAVQEPMPRGRNAGRELLDSPIISESRATRELFPDKLITPLKESNGNAGRDLFDGRNSRASSPFHRRTDAFDIDDATASNSPKVEARHARPSRNLADRVTGGPAISPSQERGSKRPDVMQQGFAIKGMHSRVRELFPEKEPQKDLFGDGANGGGARGGRMQRKKAEDLFG